MQTEKDLYDILGVSKDATLKEIKSAYKELSKKYHPDKEGGDQEKFKEINNAYRILSDEAMRNDYDLTGNTDTNKFNKIKKIAVDLFFETISSLGDQALYEDVFKRMINKLYSDISQARQGNNVNKNAINNFKKLKSRIKGKDNFFLNIVEDKIIQIEEMCKRNNEKIVTMEETIEFIKNYKMSSIFDPDFMLEEDPDEPLLLNN